MRTQPESRRSISRRKPRFVLSLRRSALVIWLVVTMLAAQLPAARSDSISIGTTCGDNQRVELSSLFANQLPAETDGCCCDLEAMSASSGCPMGTSSNSEVGSPAPAGCDCNWSPEESPKPITVWLFPIGSSATESLHRGLDTQLQVAYKTLALVDLHAVCSSAFAKRTAPVHRVNATPLGSVLATRLTQGGTSLCLAELSTLLI
ncbi:MAG: hypothetical protein ACI8TQ_002225 [Planctomycetota bacterium]|jgi:hypothetical protein